MAETLSQLGNFLKNGCYLDVLLSTPAEQLIADYVTSITNSITRSQDATSSPSPGERLAVGLAAFNAFLQANVTGPVLDDQLIRHVEKRFFPSGSQRRVLRTQFLRALDVDGVSVYEHIPHVELFGLAKFVVLEGFISENDDVTEGLGLDEKQGAERSLRWLALRIRVWHYKLLTSPNLGPGSVFNKSQQWCDVPSLQGEIERGLQEVEGMVLNGERRWSALHKVQFLVEKANVHIILGQEGKAKDTLKRATALSGFVYALSGALGKRTKFQKEDISQLVVLAKSGEVSADAGNAAEQPKPEALPLNDDTLLENVEFSKDAPKDDPKADLPEALRDLKPDEQPQLSSLDQIILLAEATIKDAFSPADSLTLEEVLPFAVRVINDKSTNWQIYTHALLVRSRIEVHRSRTVERGVLQMQAVVDQVVVDTTQPVREEKEKGEEANESGLPEIKVTEDGEDEKPTEPKNKPTTFFPAPKPTETAPPQIRLEYIHTLSSPPRWHLESELAYSWAGVGSLVSAMEIFKRLRLWAEVALCYAGRAAADDEEGRGSGGEAKAKAILRWRLFHRTGTIEGDIDEDADVDELKEADFQGPERQPPPPNAPRLWCILGEIENDPAHYERAWEISNHRYARAQKSLGEYYLRQKDIWRAREAYQKAVSVNRLSSELWNRLGDINLRLGDFAEAADAFGRAIAASDNAAGGEDARTWSNLGSALYSLYVERMREMKKAKEEGREVEQHAPVDLSPDYDDEELTTNTQKPSDRDPATLLAQSLAAYKKGANIAHDNWRIWDNVITLAYRMRPIPVSDLLLGLRNLVRLKSTEDVLDISVLRVLLNEGVLSKEKPAGDDESKVYEPPRGTEERAVCEFVEKSVVPLITTRSELWELVARERIWRRDYAGAIDAAERAWRAAIGGGGGVGVGASSLSPSSAKGEAARKNWIEDREAFGVVLERTEELVSILENYGERVPELGERWKGKARMAVRSVMGKAKESWEGTEEWEKLDGLLEGLR
ncbi:uncharacterized protein CTHT_0064890 [Thermochaetoides thermophila DSM 1495]|uniref:Uncharacterized protein n=1 Tax=Chaetomium thermophilum (strain DSM 1495 / CBS 144.50 / IMI 039719) TaxID=759272 RepID=G0SG35_CHATD|nr:hypothetical protein CTHT_0064890 [Thermochaetoides thermophila DSM 1495]EGS17174.1 hypothetical protein CTHT_0064890 [Thermochaetoides thermophila DSM 1495]